MIDFDTIKAHTTNNRVSLDHVADYFLNRKIESPRDECLVIAKLYNKLTTDPEIAISNEEMDFLVQYELPHILHLEDMRSLGFPCNLKAIDKTKKALVSLKKNILKKLSKSATELDMRSLDVSETRDQKNLINKILSKKRKEPISRMTNDQLDKYPDIAEVCMALDFRRVTKAIG